MTKTQIANYRRFVRSSAPKPEPKIDASYQLVVISFAVLVLTGVSVLVWRAI